MSPHPEPSPFYIVGPTGSGKSAAAMALATRIGGEIVNADAFQLYRGLDIVTAKPSTQDQRAVPHHLIDVLDPSETCDAHRYRTMALPIIEDIARRGRTPIIVGGSGLYVKALSHGLAPVPPGDPGLRDRLMQFTLPEKIVWLLRRDPQAAKTVNLRNPRYVDRALEICLMTGRPQSHIRQTFARPPANARGVVLQWSRHLLHERINQRVLDMVNAGLEQEVRRLAGLSSTAGKAIGIREMQQLIAGAWRLDEAIAAMQQATRRYAKRQITWFKRESWLQTICLDPESTPDSAASEILKHFPDLNP